MTPEEAAQVRAEWAAVGNLPCRHLILFAEFLGEFGELTGNYVCSACGTEMTVTQVMMTLGLFASTIMPFSHWRFCRVPWLTRHGSEERLRFFDLSLL